jgi:pimeloyl-ACP methyl ester carboxylesterase
MERKMKEWHLRQSFASSQGEVKFDIIGSGRPIVLLHGTPSWSYLWRDVVDLLAEDWSVHLYDFAGYGDSAKYDGQDVSIAAQADVFVELLDHWRLDRPFVVGHDFGGATSLRTLTLKRRSFSGLALIDAVALRPWGTPFSRLVRENIGVFQRVPHHVFASMIAAHIRNAIHKPMSDAALAPYLAPWLAEGGQDAYLRMVAGYDERYTAEMEELYGTIDIPTLVLWGENDQWLDPAFAVKLAQAIPGACLQTIPEAGHFLPEDQPAAVAKALSHFFAGIRRKAA